MLEADRRGDAQIAEPPAGLLGRQSVSRSLSKQQTRRAQRCSVSKAKLNLSFD